jgi:DNA-binding PucR family transcriptional regulator
MNVTAHLLQTVASLDHGALRAGLLRDAIVNLANAAERGQQVLFAEARILFRNLLDVEDVRILVQSAGAWREWDKLDSGGDEPVIGSLPDISSSTHVHLDNAIFVPVQIGSVALLIDGLENPDVHRDVIDTLCHVLRLAIGSSESKHGNPDKLEAIRVFQRVANRILKSRNLQEILLQITHEAKVRLSADICGIMLLEDNALVMMRCTGNISAEMASLRMRAGQGVGGRVLKTREACSIEDYVQSEIISRDFFDLARVERVRSALAVPMISQDKIIGVLEVWRRKPSTFTPQHTAELATLANLASLAIENANLFEAHELAALRLEEAHTKLQQRYDVIRKSADLQESLISTLLAGGGLSEIVGRAYKHLETPVLVLDKHMDVQACHPSEACPEALLLAIQTAISQNAGVKTRHSTLSAEDIQFVFQNITAGSEQFGWVVLLEPHVQDESTQLAITELCVTAALHLTKERAAARALSDKLATLTWDLLEGPDHLRKLALERAKELNAGVPTEYCVLVCCVEGLDTPNSSGVLTGGEIESRRRSVVEAPGRLPGAHRFVKLSSLRANELAVVVAMRNDTHIRDLAQGLIADIKRRVPGATARAGISRPSSDPMGMPAAWRDARIALDVARQSGKTTVVGFDDVGVAGLLMSIRDGADFQAFVNEKLGKILQEKVPQRDVLMKTLNIFFASNCSQQATAKELRTHQKTIAYRLDKVERITGLDLACHEHRVLLYLALRMTDLIT